MFPLRPPLQPLLLLILEARALWWERNVNHMLRTAVAVMSGSGNAVAVWLAEGVPGVFVCMLMSRKLIMQSMPLSRGC